jgi:GNAT superfamily N-acetyltransferase
MNHHESINVVPLTGATIPAVTNLLLRQQARQSLHDPRLFTRTRDHITANLARQRSHGQTVVILDAQGEVCGYGHATVWELKEASILQAFLTRRNGVVQYITLPDPDDTSLEAVVRALFTACDTIWQNAATTGALFRWPSTDTAWIEPFLLERGFQLDSICALRPPQPFFRTQPSTASCTVRCASPEDEQALVALFQEELLFHSPYTPFVRSSPQVLDAFRRKLTRMWPGERLEEGAPLILVAEQAGEVVAMVENTLVLIQPEEEPGFTPPGRYWCIDNISVRTSAQGQGIGRLLLQAVEEDYLALKLGLEGYILWYNPANPKAASFWEHLGFQPLRTTYQRISQHP